MEKKVKKNKKKFHGLLRATHPMLKTFLSSVVYQYMQYIHFEWLPPISDYRAPVWLTRRWRRKPSTPARVTPCAQTSPTSWTGLWTKTSPQPINVSFSLTVSLWGAFTLLCFVADWSVCLWLVLPAVYRLHRCFSVYPEPFTKVLHSSAVWLVLLVSLNQIQVQSKNI